MAKRIQKKDWDNIEQFVQDELSKREGSEFRKKHQNIWKEVDRQVSMESMSRTPKNNKETDWRNAIELGELSRASEIISADVKRFSFPQTRSWFEVHTELPPQMTEQGPMPVDPYLQRRIDGRTRAFMTQQQLDFGFKSRVSLSVKEALHHGSYVATIEWEDALQVTDGTGVSTISAPVWKPHSMWNCFPDLSAGIDGHNTFYQGSMLIRSYKPKYQVERMRSSDPEYPFFNLDKIEEGNKPEHRQNTTDVELLTYYGDIVVPRQGKDLLLLNSRVIIANGRIIHYMPNPYSFPPIIYNGWERLDVRDPYFVSPIVKFSVDQKIGTQLANRLLDNVDLKVEPPCIYDGNDPDFVRNGGPEIAPGAKTSTKGTGNYQFMDVGDPNAALAGLQFIIGQIEAGTRVDRVRSGVSPATEQTATEVVKQSQNAEISVVDFVDTHEHHGLRPALYMMYHLNRKNLRMYPFYNQELDSPDFERMTPDELAESVHFEIVGSKGVLGEERRQAQTSQVTAFWMQANPQLLRQQELAKEMFRDAGNKNPEKFLNVSDEAMQMQQQMQAAIQQIQQEAAMQIEEMAKKTRDMEVKLVKEMAKVERAMIDSEQKDVEKAGKDVRIQSLQEQIKLIKAEQNLIKATSEQMNDLREAVFALAGDINAPKKIVFDEEGRPVGIERELNS